MRICRSLKMIEKILKARKADKIILVVSAFLMKKLSWAVKEIKQLALPDLKIITIPDGEVAKGWDVLGKLLSDFIEAKLDKNSLVIAMGGGSATDLVGLACSLHGRGIFYINIPTTLLAQVDASIGGKTAINFKGYKNQIGAFYMPVATIIVDRFLETLNGEQLIDGLAEIIKAGLIKDPVILDIIEFHNLAGLKKRSVLRRLVCRAIAVKKYFVCKDPKDNNIRHALNFGHTVAHALELGYGLSHGRAVLIGMVEECKMCEELGLCNSEARLRLEKILRRLNISLFPGRFKVNWESILHDKKIAGKEISLPIVQRVGRVKLVKVRLDKYLACLL